MSEKHLLKGFKLPSEVTIQPREEKNGRSAMFVMEPFERGFATTVGNALRRVLISSIQGFSVTAVRVTIFNTNGSQKFITSEFDTIEGIKEDTIDVFDSIKKIKFIVEDPEITQLTLSSECKGAKKFANNIFESTGVKIVNPNDLLFTATSDIDILVELELELGRGYLPSEETEKRIDEIGTIPIDALFSPIQNVNFDVSSVRIGRRSDYERLTITVETDGRISALNAVAHASKVIKEVIQPLINFDEAVVEQNEQVSQVDVELEKKFALSVEELELSQRSSNCLKAANVLTLKDLAQLTEKDIEGLPNFGKKSMDEVKEKLKQMELTLGMEFE